MVLKQFMGFYWRGGQDASGLKVFSNSCVTHITKNIFDNPHQHLVVSFASVFWSFSSYKLTSHSKIVGEHTLLGQKSAEESLAWKTQSCGSSG